jgi:hypothetical protein
VATRGFAGPAGLPAELARKLVGALQMRHPRADHTARMRGMAIPGSCQGPESFAR